MAIPAILELDARVPARCAESGEEIPLTFRKGELDAGEGVVHFAVPPRHFWDNVGYT